jgi:transposase
MMGKAAASQDELFYTFNLARHVPRDHLLRGIDAVLDLDAIRKALAPYYSSTGRPSIDPELMIRMLIIGYAFGIRSERRLCGEVHLNGGRPKLLLTPQASDFGDVNAGLAPFIDATRLGQCDSFELALAAQVGLELGKNA